MTMNKIQNIDNTIIADVATRIERLITDARANVARAVNLTEVITKYEIGHVIVSVVQGGAVRAAYGKQLLKGVSEILTERLGDGWSVDTLEKCRKFYHAYSKSAASLRKLVKSPKTYPFTLSWSHYLVLMRIESDEERCLYEIEAQKQNWSVRQLQRQYSSSLYERLALSRNKEEVMRLARQKRFTFDEEDFFVDLVFYNRLLQRYVLIDLKVGKLSHQDLGQMQMYVNYYICPVFAGQAHIAGQAERVDRRAGLTDEYAFIPAKNKKTSSVKK